MGTNTLHLYVCTLHVYIHIYVYAYVCTCCLYIYIYVYIYFCIYICIYFLCIVTDRYVCDLPRVFSRWPETSDPFSGSWLTWRTGLQSISRESSASWQGLLFGLVKGDIDRAPTKGIWM